VFEEGVDSRLPPRRRALEVALLLAEPGEGPPDPLAIGLAVHDLLRALARQGSLLVAVDDVQWLDPAWSARNRRPAIKEGAIDVVPDVVVEVLSAATRSNALGVKRGYYLDVGARELWLADPSADSLTRVRPSVDDEELSSTDTLGSELLNGFSLVLSRVFTAT
jgi:hypothetical protein